MKNYNPNLSDNLIVRLSFEFALEIIKYSDKLTIDKRFVISKQVLRSGTSVGANIREAQNAESLPDFIHKFKISAKEADETEYWLLLCKSSEGYPNCDNLLGKIEQIEPATFVRTLS